MGIIEDEQDTDTVSMVGIVQIRFHVMLSPYTGIILFSSPAQIIMMISLSSQDSFKICVFQIHRG